MARTPHFADAPRQRIPKLRSTASPLSREDPDRKNPCDGSVQAGDLGSEAAINAGVDSDWVGHLQIAHSLSHVFAKRRRTDAAVRPQRDTRGQFLRELTARDWPDLNTNPRIFRSDSAGTESLHTIGGGLGRLETAQRERRYGTCIEVNGTDGVVVSVRNVEHARRVADAARLVEPRLVPSAIG